MSKISRMPIALDFSAILSPLIILVLQAIFPLILLLANTYRKKVLRRMTSTLMVHVEEMTK